MKKLIIGVLGAVFMLAVVPETMAKPHHHDGNDGLRLATGIVNLVRAVIAPAPVVVTPTPVPVVVTPTPAPVVVTPTPAPVVVYEQPVVTTPVVVTQPQVVVAPRPVVVHPPRRHHRPAPPPRHHRPAPQHRGGHRR